MRISLGFTQVGDPGLAALAKLKRLSSLDLTLSRVTAAGAKAAIAAHPGLRILGP
jgi:hypothetical protein